MSRVVVLAALLLGMVSARAADPAGSWTRWEIPLPEGARAWCCFDGPRRDGTALGCELGPDHSRIEVPGNGRARVYLRREGQAVRDVQVYAAYCPVQSALPITDLGTRTPDQSLDQILGLSLEHERLYPAIAAHGTPAAAEALRERAARGRGEARDQAWFWYALLAPPDAESVLLAALREAPAASDPPRDPLVFALTQLPAPRSTRALLTVLRDPQQPLDTRKQTLFWLGQSEDPTAHRAVADLLD